MMGRIFVGEIIATFLFVSFVLQVVKHNGAKDAPVNTVAIGLCLFIAITLTSGVSGGCVNPAVGFVQPVFQRIFYKTVYPKADPLPLTYYAAYIFAPTIGGILAGVYQRTLNEFAQGKADMVAKDAKANQGEYTSGD
jgi:glycerol uptake facilitator protein